MDAPSACVGVLDMAKEMCDADVVVETGDIATLLKDAAAVLAGPESLRNDTLRPLLLQAVQKAMVTHTASVVCTEDGINVLLAVCTGPERVLNWLNWSDCLDVWQKVVSCPVVVTQLERHAHGIVCTLCTLVTAPDYRSDVLRIINTLCRTASESDTKVHTLLLDELQSKWELLLKALVLGQHQMHSCHHRSVDVELALHGCQLLATLHRPHDKFLSLQAVSVAVRMLELPAAADVGVAEAACVLLAHVGWCRQDRTCVDTVAASAVTVVVAMLSRFPASERIAAAGFKIFNNMLAVFGADPEANLEMRSFHERGGVKVTIDALRTHMKSLTIVESALSLLSVLTVFGSGWERTAVEAMQVAVTAVDTLQRFAASDALAHGDGDGTIIVACVLVLIDLWDYAGESLRLYLVEQRICVLVVDALATACATYGMLHTHLARFVHEAINMVWRGLVTELEVVDAPTLLRCFNACTAALARWVASPADATCSRAACDLLMHVLHTPSVAAGLCASQVSMAFAAVAKALQALCSTVDDSEAFDVTCDKLLWVLVVLVRMYGVSLRKLTALRCAVNVCTASVWMQRPGNKSAAVVCRLVIALARTSLGMQMLLPMFQHADSPGTQTLTQALLAVVKNSASGKTKAKACKALFVCMATHEEVVASVSAAHGVQVLGDALSGVADRTGVKHRLLCCWVCNALVLIAGLHTRAAAQVAQHLSTIITVMGNFVSYPNVVVPAKRLVHMLIAEDGTVVREDGFDTPPFPFGTRGAWMRACVVSSSGRCCDTEQSRSKAARVDSSNPQCCSPLLQHILLDRVRMCTCGSQGTAQDSHLHSHALTEYSYIVSTFL